MMGEKQLSLAILRLGHEQRRLLADILKIMTAEPGLEFEKELDALIGKARTSGICFAEQRAFADRWIKCIGGKND